MTTEAVAPEFPPFLTGALPAPREDAATAAIGPLPWLTGTGHLDQALAAWGRGHLAEAPTGITFDVLQLQVPDAVAEDIIRRMREAGRRMGPVIFGPTGAEFIVEPGSTASWSAPRSVILRPGTLVLLPPPTVLHPETVAARGWLVSPCHRETGAPLCAGLTPAGALLEPYLAALMAAKSAEGHRGVGSTAPQEVPVWAAGPALDAAGIPRAPLRDIVCETCGDYSPRAECRFAAPLDQWAETHTRHTGRRDFLQTTVTRRRTVAVSFEPAPPS